MFWFEHWCYFCYWGGGRLKDGVYELHSIPQCPDGLVLSVSTSHAVGHGFMSRPGHTKDHHNKSANAWALCHPPSASFCSVLARQRSSRIFTHDRYNFLSDILTEFEVNLGIIIEKYDKT